ncbi:MAG: tetratricopeptide repeat protein [Azospirillaceae bacterium]
MADVFREIDEELRQDRVKTAARRYGPIIGGIAAVVILGTAAWTGWSQWQESRAEGRTTALAQALDRADGSPVEARALLDELAAGGGGSQAVLARYNAAALAAEAGDTAAAVEAFRAIAADSSVDQALRDAALVTAALHALEIEDPGQVAAEVEPLATGDGPWRFSAREIQAAAALRQGDTARAGDIAADLAEAVEAPPGLRQRAAELAAALGVEAEAPGDGGEDSGLGEGGTGQ